MNRTFRAILPVLLLAFALQSPTLADPPAATAQSAAVTKLKEAVSKELVALADAASDNGLNGKATVFLNEALQLTPEDRKAAKAIEKLPDLADTTDAAAIARYEKKADKPLKKAATAYCGLFGELKSDKDTATVNAYLLRAFELHAETADKYVEVEYRAAFAKKDYAAAHRLLDLAQGLQLDDEKQNAARAKAMLECEAAISAKSPIMKTCRGHVMKYYLSLPAGWSAEKKWPVYVAVEGAGSNFLGACNGARGKGNDTFIVVTPIGFTNTNALDEGMRKKYPYPKEVIDEADQNRMKFDEPGLLAIISDLQELYNAEAKVCITGFSGGGILTWHMVFTHPDKLLAAVPACANFGGTRAEISSDAEAKKALVIHAYQGDKDQYKESMLDAQWEAAEKLARENGYENVKRDIIPGGHISCHPQAREVFLKALGKAD
jgi:poly(3-hydroxybutyrate) depolymerase